MTRITNSYGSFLPRTFVLLAPLLAVGCPEPEVTPTDETGTETSAGDGDGDVTGDGDGDVTGDGDGDVTGDGDGDGDMTGDGDGDMTGDGDGDGDGPTCGDGVVDDGESCDDGNADNSDGCLTSCEVPRDCVDVLAVDPAAPSGVYVVDFDGPDAIEATSVYCDMETDGGGWMMVYKITSGLDGDAAALWTGGALNDDNLALLDPGPGDAHYVSRYISEVWTETGVVEGVRIHAYDDGAIGSYFLFDATNSGAGDWLAKPNLAASPYDDIVALNQLYFSLEGHDVVGRRFFIHRQYGNCANDSGWLVADAPQDDCAWESDAGDPIRVLYATGATLGNWNDIGGSTDVADTLAVFVRTSDGCGDGVVAGFEDCDDQNDDETDGCLSTCTIPQSCADWAEADPNAADGEYEVYYEADLDQPWTVYCDDMAGEPKDYLPLVEVGPDLNFSQYTAGGSSPGTDVRTNFERLRIDPVTLEVDIEDLSFANSTGSLMHINDAEVTQMSYAIAMGCNSAPNGLANIDLSGTPFYVDDPTCLAGFNSVGLVDFSADAKVVNLTGGGACGWRTPAPCVDNPHLGMTGLTLDLAYAKTSTVFLTSTQVNGDLGGLAGADQACQDLADAANLDGTFKAWLSDSQTSAADRLVQSPTAYVRTDGAQIAANWDDLVDAMIDMPIVYDESGAEIGNPSTVWTATATDGTYAGPSCADWTSADPGDNGVSGSPPNADFWWTQIGTTLCSAPLHLYCFEQ